MAVRREDGRRKPIEVTAKVRMEGMEMAEKTGGEGGGFAAIEHVGIAAKDPARLADWYRETFGWREVMRTDASPPVVFLATPAGDMVEILPAKTSLAGEKDNFDRGYVHLAIRVEDYDAAVEHIRRAGGRLEGDPIDSKGTKVRFFRDPEGNLLHVIRRQRPLVER
ncbi:MAG: VOC family protein [Planctomycetota bacterium]|nr:VOC family protein [Planctomycetota bacterium]